jgi:Protein DA1/LIM domain
MYHKSLESEDELLARRLQEEEELSASNHHVDLSRLSKQEREDMMLARQMQEMDAYHRQSNNHHGGQSPAADPQRHRRDQMIDSNKGGAQRNLPTSASGGSIDPSGIYSGYGNIPDGSASSFGTSNSSSSREDRLAYARRLQEDALQRVQATAKSPPKQSTEESDLELAMKMQIEEGDPSHHEQEDEDMKLARFMEESGVSIRELDAVGLAAVKDGASSGTSSLTWSSPNNSSNLQNRGTGVGGGSSMLSGLYGSRRDDSDDDDSIDFDNQRIPAGVPSAIPQPARPNIAGIPASIPRNISPPAAIPPAGSKPAPKSTPTQAVPGAILPTVIPSGIPPVAFIPSGILPPASIPFGIPPVSAVSTAIPPATGLRKSPPVASIPRRGDFQRQLPQVSKSSGPGLSPLSRVPPSPSNSFSQSRSRGSTPTRRIPTHTQSAMNLMGRAARSDAGRDRSLSPTRGGARRGKKEHKRNKSQGPDLSADFLGDLPPGVNMGPANDPDGLLLNEPLVPDADDQGTPARKEKMVGKLFGKFFRGKNSESRQAHASSNQTLKNHSIPEAIPAAIPLPPGGMMGPGPLPYSAVGNRDIAENYLRTSFSSLQPPAHEKKQTTTCSVCGGRSGKMLVAMDKKFHVECFRCMSCNELIDPASVFAVSIDPLGEQQPLHRKCYAEFYGVQCAVCKRAIPANDDGSVSFIKHPFFNSEQMCPSHADEAGRRRCTGCHRFEPEDEPFADLGDGDRCVCYACCRTVIMNNTDAKPLWDEVLRFFEFQLHLPIWEEMRDIPILVVGQAALNENQLNSGTSVHGDSSQIMTRGLCLSEHDGNMSFSFRVPSQRFNDSTASFEACNHSGFVDFDIGSLKGNVNSEVMAILCLSGLPRDLTASVLAHEATHAWIKLHPSFKVRKSLPAQVEEGCAQLVAYLFLSDGLEPPRRNSGMGPSDERLRQYFKFSIETDENDIYGEGYRKAALAYSSIGIKALLNHVVHFQSFPQCLDGAATISQH